MNYDTVVKVGDGTVTIKGRKPSPAKRAERDDVKAKVVAPPEKKAPRKSTGASSKEV
jgi:hypothetical protein